MKTGRKGKRMAASAAALFTIFSMLAGVLAGGAGAFETVAGAEGKYLDTSDYPSLKEIYKDYFRLGVAVQAIDHWNDPTAEIGNEAKEELIRQSFNSMTFGNELKPAYNFDPASPTLFKVDPAAEELLTFAKENGIPVRGHVLVWHSQVEPGFFAKDFKALSGGNITHSEKDVLDEDCLVDKKELLDRLKTYICGAMEYIYQNGFADTVYAWDVVNEAVDEGKPDGLRQSYWYKIIGPEFLYYSFLYAREAELTYAKEYAADYGLDPEGDLSPILPELFYNDYNEWYGRRCDITIRFLTEDVYNQGQSMVKSFAIKEGGDGTIFGDGLVDGIGMQGHLDDNQKIDTYINALRRYDEAVGNVHITELDVGKSGSGANAEFNQAEFYYNFFDALVKEKEAGVHLNSVTFWGLTDDASWRKGADPLLFYGDLGRKPAFEAVVAAGKREEFTMTEAEVLGPLTEMNLDFEPYKQGDTTVTWTPETAGFFSRGTGHQSELFMVMNENHTEGAKAGVALKVVRNEQDATAKIDISRFAGSAIRAEIYAKTSDATVMMGVEGEETEEIAKENPGEDWVLLSGTYKIPEDWKGVSLYFETDGNADLLLDDLRIEVIDEAEITAPESGNDDTAITGDDTSVQNAEAAEEPAGAASETGTKKGPALRILVPVLIVAAAAAVLAVFLIRKRKKETGGQS
ncbi:MAG: endo-1,4-beta-xylanase [Lachnospiraceae bacterium]|nr:endo-1,4-beta-xylanase [Lachnospiraceae bacterium]